MILNGSNAAMYMVSKAVILHDKLKSMTARLYEGPVWLRNDVIGFGDSNDKCNY